MTILKQSYSLHKIMERDNLPFDAEEYSRFKYGSKGIARVYGKQLASNFYFAGGLRQYLIAKPDTQIVVISSPYNFIPTATFALKDYFVQRLNKTLVANLFKPVEETKIHRTLSYREDYGSLDAEARMKLIGNDSFHIDEVFCRGKLLLFLDDIKITGSHERVIERMYDQYGLKNDHFYLYFAELANKDIHPNIENDLNFGYVKNLRDLDSIIKDEEFLLNTRTVKYILNYENKPEAETFLEYQRQAFLNNLYHQAIGNSYHTVPEYQHNLNYLKSLVKF